MAEIKSGDTQEIGDRRLVGRDGIEIAHELDGPYRSPGHQIEGG